MSGDHPPEDHPHDHEHRHGRRTTFDYLLDLGRNWKASDEPLLRKTELFLRNRARGLVTRRFCCGRRGQPGC